MEIDEHPSADPDPQQLLRRMFPDGVFAADVLAALGSDGTDRERCTRALGEALWGVLSDNNDIVLPDGREFELTWRCWGYEIADFLNEATGAEQFDYMDFYMCGANGGGPHDVDDWRAGTALAFRRLLALGVTWRSGSSYPAVVEIHRSVVVPDGVGHTMTEEVATAEDAARMGGPSLFGNLGCAFLMLVPGAVLLWMLGGWVASFFGDDAEWIGNVAALVVVAWFGLPMLWEFAGDLRRDRRLARTALEAGRVEVIRVRARRVVQWDVDHSSLDPSICFDIGGGKLLMMIGQWLWEERTYGVPNDIELEDSDEIDETYVNRLPPPWSFPATAFTVRRVALTGEVLSIQLEGEYLPPEPAGFLLEGGVLDHVVSSSILDGTLDDLDAALRRGSPALFDDA